MKVSEVMIRDFGTVAPEESLQFAAQLMADLDTDALPVGDDKALQGILTGRDIVLRAVAHGLDPRKTKVAEVMSSHIVTCRPEDNLDDVAEQMGQHQIRRMPVVDGDGSLVGMISHRDMPLART